jgi:hypothetical protein
MKGATALLYFGPLLAGLGGAGWRIVPVFAGIFLLWLFILRPQLWPRRLADWARPEALVTLASQVAVQVLLVLVCFGIGRGIGGVLGAMPPFPQMLPVAISFLSIPICRMLWDPWKDAELNTFLDEALTQIQTLDPDAAPDPKRGLFAARMVKEMQNLPEDTTPEVLSAHLFAMATQTDHAALRAALMDPIYDGTASEVIRRAAVVHATDGRVADYLGGTRYAMSVFRELREDALLFLFAKRAHAMVAEDGDTAAECPDPAVLRAQVVTRAETRAALTALADLIDAQAVA